MTHSSSPRDSSSAPATPPSTALSLAVAIVGGGVSRGMKGDHATTVPARPTGSIAGNWGTRHAGLRSANARIRAMTFDETIAFLTEQIARLLEANIEVQFPGFGSREASAP